MLEMRDGRVVRLDVIFQFLDSGVQGCNGSGNQAEEMFLGGRGDDVVRGGVLEVDGRGQGCVVVGGGVGVIHNRIVFRFSH